MEKITSKKLKTMEKKTHFTAEQAKSIGDQLNIDWNKIPIMWTILKSRIIGPNNNEIKINNGAETISIHKSCISGVSLLSMPPCGNCHESSP